MIYIFYGDDRLKAEKAAEKILGTTHETVDGENLQVADLPTIFLGATFFDEDQRKILIKDLFTIKILGDEIEKYLDTPHEIVCLEQTFKTNTVVGKKLKNDKRVKLQEFKKPEAVDKFLSYNVFDLALKNGDAAVQKLRPAEITENPYAMVGAWATKTAKAYASNPRNLKNKRILKELARVDLMLKTTNFSENPWPVLELFLQNLRNL